MNRLYRLPKQINSLYLVSTNDIIYVGVMYEELYETLGKQPFYYCGSMDFTAFGSAKDYHDFAYE